MPELPVNYTRLTWQERRAVREQYISEQNGHCHHCKGPLSDKATKEMLDKRVDRRRFPENFFKYPVHLHHCHNTGMTIGAVHNHCNAVLWQYHGE